MDMNSYIHFPTATQHHAKTRCKLRGAGLGARRGEAQDVRATTPKAQYTCMEAFCNVGFGCLWADLAS